MKCLSLFIFLATTVLAKGKDQNKLDPPHRPDAPDACIDLCNKYGKGSHKLSYVCFNCVENTIGDVSRCAMACRDQRMDLRHLYECNRCIDEGPSDAWTYPGDGPIEQPGNPNGEPYDWWNLPPGEGMIGVAPTHA